MRIVMLEPLGVKEEKIRSLAAALEKQGHDFVMYNTRTEDKSELIARASDADAVILSNLPFKDEVISECKSLKMISVAFTGVDHIGVSLCRERGIAVRNAAGYSTPSVAELAYGLMISVLRNIVKCDAATRSGKTKDGLVGNDLCGKTLGIVGMGAIGTKVAEIGRAFGCSLLAYSRTEKEEAKALGVKFVDLDTLMSQSDIVTLHVPLNENTKALIDKNRLAMMKPSAILINTARGPVVDSQALAEALKEGRLAGAGIDVYETEPPIKADHPLLNAPNAVLAPHVAFATKEALERRADIAFDNVISWMNGISKNVIV
jgi:D-3-phosphoglycerate dehydrogenase